MSGRRSSSAEGRPGGTTGTWAASVAGRDGQFGRRVPGQHGDRMLELLPLHADGDQLRLGRLQLRQRGHVVDAGRRAGTILVFGDLQRAPVGGDGFGQQLAKRILGAQVEIVGGERRLRRQLRVRQIGRADLGGGGAALHLPADAAPDVQIPGDGSADRVLRAAAPAAAERGTRRSRTIFGHCCRRRCRFGSRPGSGQPWETGRRAPRPPARRHCGTAPRTVFTVWLDTSTIRSSRSSSGSW